MIGWRAALVVALAIPICYSLTLFINLLLGYTINRVTLFALILALIYNYLCTAKEKELAGGAPRGEVQE